MKVNYYTHYSNDLGRDMNVEIYGHDGQIIFAFPSQNGIAHDFASNGMIHCIANYIEEGRCMVVCVDGNDTNSWSAEGGDYGWRIEQQERYLSYVSNQLVHDVYEYYLSIHGYPYEGNILTTGCSMGATHALIFALRYPQLFTRVIALSGVYHASFFFPNYNDTRIYYNSPCDMLSNMSPMDPMLDLYRNLDLILCCGQGAWEVESQEDLHTLQYHFNRLGIPAWCDFWGYDVNHDWPWWRVQLPYFLGKMLGE